MPVAVSARRSSATDICPSLPSPAPRIQSTKRLPSTRDCASRRMSKGASTTSAPASAMAPVSNGPLACAAGSWYWMCGRPGRVAMDCMAPAELFLLFLFLRCAQTNPADGRNAQQLEGFTGECPLQKPPRSPKDAQTPASAPRGCKPFPPLPPSLPRFMRVRFYESRSRSLAQRLHTKKGGGGTRPVRWRRMEDDEGVGGDDAGWRRGVVVGREARAAPYTVASWRMRPRSRRRRRGVGRSSRRRRGRGSVRCVQRLREPSEAGRGCGGLGGSGRWRWRWRRRWRRRRWGRWRRGRGASVAVSPDVCIILRRRSQCYKDTQVKKRTHTGDDMDIHGYGHGYGHGHGRGHGHGHGGELSSGAPAPGGARGSGAHVVGDGEGVGVGDGGGDGGGVVGVVVLHVWLSETHDHTWCSRPLGPMTLVVAS